ncbi:unnamed protein product [Leuciscus chuanchicus]
MNGLCCSDRRLEVKQRSIINTSDLGSLNEISEDPAQGSKRGQKSLGMNQASISQSDAWDPVIGRNASQNENKIGKSAEQKSGDESVLHRPIRRKVSCDWQVSVEEWEGLQEWHWNLIGRFCRQSHDRAGLTPN